MKKLLGISAAALGLLAFASLTQAQVITWGTATNMSGDTDVANNGIAFDAVTFYSTATTVNGVTFNPLNTSVAGGVSDASGNISITNFTGFPLAGGSYAAYTGGSANYNNVVSTLIFSQGGVGFGPTVTLSNLTIGHTYQVEVWAYDGNLVDNGSVTTQLTGATAPNGLLNGTPSTTTAGGQFVIGDFTATATTDSFQALQTQSFSVFNTVSVLDVTGAPEPSEALLLGMGLMTVVILTQRKRFCQSQVL